MTALLIRLITGVRAHWYGEPPDRRSLPCVYFANHASNLDAPVIWASLPRALRERTRPVAARDYWERGPVRRWLAGRVFRTVLIERHRVTPSNNPLRAMEAALDAGDSLILFPEGTRGAGGAGGDAEGDAEGGAGGPGGVQAFKAGLYHLAKRRPELPLVPVYLENLNRILPKGEVLLVPLLAAARFGAPMRLEAGEPREAFLARARQAVGRLAHGEDCP